MGLNKAGTDLMLLHVDTPVEIRMKETMSKLLRMSVTLDWSQGGQMINLDPQKHMDFHIRYMDPGLDLQISQLPCHILFPESAEQS